MNDKHAVPITKSVERRTFEQYAGGRVMSWTCDTCGGSIEREKDGWVEWVAFTDRERDPLGRGLRLVHAATVSPRGHKGCQYVEDDLPLGECVCDLGLSDFNCPDGLVRLLGFIQHGDLPTEEVVTMIQRLNVPGYEQARPFMAQAVAGEVVSPRMPEGFFHVSQIETILEWVRERRT